MVDAICVSQKVLMHSGMIYGKLFIWHICVCFELSAGLVCVCMCEAIFNLKKTQWNEICPQSGLSRETGGMFLERHASAEFFICIVVVEEKFKGRYFNLKPWHIKLPARISENMFFVLQVSYKHSRSKNMAGGEDCTYFIYAFMYEHMLSTMKITVFYHFFTVFSLDQSLHSGTTELKFYINHFQ